ncbi:MAG TPA: hypothetical protein VEL03_03125, partial [Streptosporangiaceae bacterium]|nr:hypothetical protein [Streptosporangiaceae bacterium]
MHKRPDQAGQPGRQPRGRAACIRLVSISGALLAAVAIAGCHHAQAIPVPGPAPTNTAGPTPPPDPTSANTPCTPWSGLSYLTDAYVDMGQLAGDEGTYGIGSEQVNSDQLGVNADQAGLTQYFQELPTAYGEA